MVYFPKLNGTNFDNWSFKMRLLLTKDGVWKVVKEEKPDPAPEDWNEKNEQAMATIGLAVEDSQLVHIRKAKTAAEAWKNLENFHVKRTLSTKVSVMRQICGLRLENNGDMEVHIGRLVELFDKLNELQPDKVLDETWLVAIMFSSLSEEYDTLVTALEARSEEDLTLTLVKGKLIDEWQKRRNRRNMDDGSEAALQTGSKLSKCFFCKKIGHQKADCEKFKSWKENQKKKTKVTKEKANNVHQGNEDENWGFFVGLSKPG